MILLVNVDFNDMHQVTSLLPPICVNRHTSRRILYFYILYFYIFYSYKVPEYLESTLRIVQ